MTLLLLLACRAPAPDQGDPPVSGPSTDTADTGSDETGDSSADTGDPPDSDPGQETDTATDTADTADTGDPPECPPDGEIVVYIRQYERSVGCWRNAARTVAAEYWWEYDPDLAEKCSDGCADMAWRLADGDTCISLPAYCSRVEPWNDPAITATPEQDAWCSGLPDSPECA